MPSSDWVMSALILLLAIAPVASDPARARMTRDDGSTVTSGTALRGLATGTRGDPIVNIPVGATTAVVESYAQNAASSGYLQVTIVPTAAVTAGARWTLGIL